MTTSTEAAFACATPEDAERLCPLPKAHIDGDVYTKRKRWIENFLQQSERLRMEAVSDDAKWREFENAETVHELKEWIKEYLL